VEDLRLLLESTKRLFSDISHIVFIPKLMSLVFILFPFDLALFLGFVAVIIPLDPMVLPLFAVKDVFERDNSCVVNKHDIFNLHDGVSHVKLRPISVFLKLVLEVNALVCLVVEYGLGLD
tara:strand:+ start:279 stop:638 length:360 start_codon:yes stop_codon:yes gene_type:complete